MTLTPTYSLKTYTIKSSTSPGTHILNVEHDYSDSDSGLGVSTTPVHLAVTPSPSSSQLNRSNLFVTPSSSARAQKSLLGGPIRSEARRRLDLDNSPQVLLKMVLVGSWHDKKLHLLHLIKEYHLVQTRSSFMVDSG